MLQGEKVYQSSYLHSLNGCDWFTPTITFIILTLFFPSKNPFSWLPLCLHAICFSLHPPTYTNVMFSLLFLILTGLIHFFLFFLKWMRHWCSDINQCVWCLKSRYNRSSKNAVFIDQQKNYSNFPSRFIIPASVSRKRCSTACFPFV